MSKSRSASGAPDGPIRQAGSREGEVMAALWAADRPLTPGEVQAFLSTELAYTTVMTMLTRLQAKGQVSRTKIGRAFAYSPVQRAEEHAAEAMSALLTRGTDPAAVLSRFVDRLGPEEEQLLRRLLERPDPSAEA